MTVKRTLLLALAALGLLLAVSAAAAPGDLDPGFGKAGLVTTTFVSHSDQEATGVALQRDGKSVVAGFTVSGQGKAVFALARYQANGSLDPSFGSGGKVTTQMAGPAGSMDVAVQPDGKIVAAGSGYIGNQFVLRSPATTRTARSIRPSAPTARPPPPSARTSPTPSRSPCKRTARSSSQATLLPRTVTSTVSRSPASTPTGRSITPLAMRERSGPRSERTRHSATP